MASKISVWREAARLLGDYRIATLTDDSAQRYAFDDAWDRTVEYTLRSAFWKFALKTDTLSDVSSVDPLPGYTNSYDLPCDWLRTHAIYIVNTANPLECPIDCKHTLEQVHTNIAEPYIRYISDDYSDPDTWPEHFSHAVAARLAFDTAERITGNPAKIEQTKAEWERAVTMALGPDALPENPWLRFQLDGSMLYGCKWLLDEAFWRFAVKTVELTGITANVSPGYTYAAEKPYDFGRAFFYYTAIGGSTDNWTPVDYRDEEGSLHSQHLETTLRYVSTDGESSLIWSDGFRRALLAYLEFEEVKRNPQAPGAVVQAKSMAWSESFKNAKLKDDLTERPRFNNVGLLNQSRRSSGTSRMHARAGGWSGW
jgi:hypothetical protein